MAKLSKKLKVAANVAVETATNVAVTGLNIVNPVMGLIDSGATMLQSEANIINQMVNEKLAQRVSDVVEGKLRLIMSSLTLASTISAIKALTVADINEIKARDIALAKKLTMAKAVVKAYEDAIENVDTTDLTKAMEDIAKLEEGIAESFSILQVGIKGLIGL